jgi:hypothetical protein
MRVLRELIVPQDASTMLSVQAPTHQYRAPPQAAVLAAKTLVHHKHPIFMVAVCFLNILTKERMCADTRSICTQWKMGATGFDSGRSHCGQRFWSALARFNCRQATQQPVFGIFGSWKDSSCFGYAMGMQGGGGAFFSPLTETGKAKEGHTGRMPVLDNPDKARFKGKKLEVGLVVVGLAREDDLISLKNGRDGVKMVDTLQWEVESLQTKQKVLTNGVASANNMGMLQDMMKD